MPFGYKYPLLALGLMLGGDFALVPLVYSTKVGFITLAELIALVLATEAITDMVWYALGRTIGEQNLYRLPFIKHKPHVIERTTEFFRNKDSQLLFASKFVYGTRIVTQVLCGAHRMNFLAYMAINLGGMFIWTMLLLVLVTVAHFGASGLDDAAKKLQISIGIFVVLVASISFVLKRIAKAKLNHG